MSRKHGAVSADVVVFVSATLISVAFVVSVFYIFNRDKDIYKLQSKKQNVDMASIANLQKDENKNPLANDEYKDTDNDGLANWEEVLWGTDPNNPDSNGNGINDGDEIKKENNVHLKKLALKIDDEDLPHNSSSTKTEIVSKKIFNSFMETLQVGGTFSTEKNMAIASDALNVALKTQNNNRDSYTLSKNQIVPATFANRIIYIKTVLNELKEMSSGDVENEIVLLFELAQGDKKESVKKISETAKFYGEHTHTLMNIKVPSDVADIHVEMIKSLLKYTKVLSDLGKLFNDPLSSADAINSFESSKNKLSASFLKLRSYIDKTINKK
jgi:hypothetical protein